MEPVRPARVLRCAAYRPAKGAIIAANGWASHRRLDAVLLCVEPGGRQFAVLMLQRDDDHRDAGLQEANTGFRCSPDMVE